MDSLENVEIRALKAEDLDALSRLTKWFWERAGKTIGKEG